jgi:hypothetical protein
MGDNRSNPKYHALGACMGARRQKKKIRGSVELTGRRTNAADAADTGGSSSIGPSCVCVWSSLGVVCREFARLLHDTGRQEGRADDRPLRRGISCLRRQGEKKMETGGLGQVHAYCRVDVVKPILGRSDCAKNLGELQVARAYRDLEKTVPGPRLKKNPNQPDSLMSRTGTAVLTLPKVEVRTITSPRKTGDEGGHRRTFGRCLGNVEASLVVFCRVRLSPCRFLVGFNQDAEVLLGRVTKPKTDPAESTKVGETVPWTKKKKDPQKPGNLTN